MPALLAAPPPLVAQAEGLASFLPLIILVAVFYLLLIRPQQKRSRQQRELVASLGVGDQVVTLGGVHGTIRTVDDDTISLEIAPGTTVTFAKQAVARRLVDADAGAGE